MDSGSHSPWGRGAQTADVRWTEECEGRLAVPSHGAMALKPTSSLARAPRWVLAVPSHGAMALKLPGQVPMFARTRTPCRPLPWGDGAETLLATHYAQRPTRLALPPPAPIALNPKPPRS